VNFIGALPNLLFGLFLFCAILMNCQRLFNVNARELPRRQVKHLDMQRQMVRLGIDAAPEQPVDLARHGDGGAAQRAQAADALDVGGAAVAVLIGVAVAFRRAGALAAYGNKIVRRNARDSGHPAAADDRLGDVFTRLHPCILPRVWRCIISNQKRRRMPMPTAMPASTSSA